MGRSARHALAALFVTGRVWAQTAPPPATQAYDGEWFVTLECADTTDRNGPVRGYAYRFGAQIVDGRLAGRHGEDGTPASVRFEGDVRADGALTIRAAGTTGANEYSLGRVARGTSYSYTMTGQLDASHGTAVRREARPCTASFTRQAAATR